MFKGIEIVMQDQQITDRSINLCVWSHTHQKHSSSPVGKQLGVCNHFVCVYKHRPMDTQMLWDAIKVP